MIRLWLVFAIFAFSMHVGITVWRKMEGKERWNLTKSIAYSILCSVLAVSILAAIVVLF